MARSKKIEWHFEVSKNTEKQGAWLMVWARDLNIDTVDGRTSVDIEEIQNSAGESAWTTQAAAKRAAAHMVGRSRLGWEEVGDGGIHFKASHLGKADA